MSRDAVAARLTLHAETASEASPALTTKKITPQVLRRTCAMRFLAPSIDTIVIALWLRHQRIETTQIYFRAGLNMKEAALARTTPTGTKTGRYPPATDKLLAFLRGL